MAKFFIGNALDASGKVIVSGNQNFSATFSYDRNGRTYTTTLYLGESVDIPVNAVTDSFFFFRATCNAPNEFTRCKVGSKEVSITSSTKNDVRYVMDAPDFTGDISRRTILLTTSSDAVKPPTEDIKTFYVGNDYANSVITATGSQNFTATLNVTVGGVVKPYDIKLGVVTKVDVLNATKVSWEVTVPSNTELCLVRRFNNVSYTPVDNKVTFDISTADLANTDDRYRQIEVKERLKGVGRFNFGNVLDNGIAKLKGTSKFSGTLSLYLLKDFTKPVFYDRASYESTSITQNFISGTSVDLTMYPYTSGTITVSPDGENKLTKAIFPSDVAIAGNAISYNLTQSERDVLNVNSRNYVVAVNDESTDPNVDPEPEPEPSEKSINNNYIVTREQLKDFEVAVNGIQKNEASISDVYWVGIQSYISSVRVIPFLIDPSNVTGGSEIKVRSESLSYGQLLNKDSILVDLGVIKVERTHNNSLDVKGVDCKLVVPFSSSEVTLDIAEIIGCDISIWLVVSVGTGVTSVNVFNQTTNKLVNSSSITIGSDYPFFTQKAVGSITVGQQQVNNNVDRAFLKVSYPDYSDAIPMASKVGVVGDKKGLVIFDEVVINNDSLADEKALLINALKDGVVIK